MYNLTTVLAALRLSQSLVNPSPAAASSELQSGFKAVNASAKGHAADCRVEPYDVPVQIPAFQPYEETKANVYRYRQQQGVNLGSLFVHEQWMTASLFECAKKPKSAEFDIAGGWGSLDNARAKLERHWDTFIPAGTFTYLASIGINTVRIPIAHFILGPQFMIGTPFEPFIEVYKNAWPRLLRIINQAAEAGIGVLIDMHGAPGSQNGQQHSGVSDGQTNFFKSQAYQDMTIEALKYLVGQLGPIINVIGVQLLNEPAGDPSLENFYSRAIDAIRQIPTYGNIPIYVHDAFDLNRFVPYINNRRDFVVQDHHSYFVFTDNDSKKPADQHTTAVRGGIADAFGNAALGERRNLVIGEWSCALTAESLSSQRDKAQAQKDFCAAQMEVYAKVTAGWYFWSWDNEQCEYDVGWCFKHAIGTALPQTFFSHPAIASLSQAQDASAKASRLGQLSDDEIASILGQGSGSGQRQQGGSNSNSYSGNPQHRFEVIHGRRPDGEYQNRDQSGSWNGGNSGPPGLVRAKGVKDGYQTAKVFAIYGMSKLGFTEQYINDAIAMAGPSGVPNGSEKEYRDGFLRGLAYGEQKIIAALGST